MSHWADKYVGLPAQGFRPCWKLVRQVWKEQKNFVLPSFDEIENPQEVVDIGSLNFTEVPLGQEQMCDAALMREPTKVAGKIHCKLESHIGVFVAPGLILHVHEGEFSRVTRASELVISRIIRGPWGDAV